LKHCDNYKALMIHFENNLHEENNNLNTNVACALNNNACRGKSDWSAAGGRRASATYTCRRQGLDGQWQGCPCYIYILMPWVRFISLNTG